MPHQLPYANGVSLKETQQWLGHSDISPTSNIYTHLEEGSVLVPALIGIPASGTFHGAPKLPE